MRNPAKMNTKPIPINQKHFYMNRKLVKANGIQLEIVRHLMKMNKKPIDINRNMFKVCYDAYYNS